MTDLVGCCAAALFGALCLVAIASFVLPDRSDKGKPPVKR